MKTLQGKTLSEGIATGVAKLLVREDLIIPDFIPENPDHEIARFEDALSKTKKEISSTISRIQNHSTKEEVEIFDAHLAMLDDPEYLKSIKLLIVDEQKNAEQAVHSVTQSFSKTLQELDDEYLEARAQDIEDVGSQVLRSLLNIDYNKEAILVHPVILVVSEISAADILGINKDFILGIITSRGGYNDHAAIIARAASIPLITGLGDNLSEIIAEDELIIDTTKGRIYIWPDVNTKRDISRRKIDLAARKTSALAKAEDECRTTDGHLIKICANVDGLESAHKARCSGADGIGLFRSEYIFMSGTQLPDEEFQYQTYIDTAECLNGKEVKIRTIDIGADKQISSLKLPKEDNPALGLRGIRLMFNQAEELLKPQVKAILRAAKDYPVKIMLPMVTSISEIREFKRLFAICQDELVMANMEFGRDIPIGIMVEVPAVAIMIENFIDEANFFSIGTNDLTQYTLSADRTNPAVSYLNEGLHPAVLHLINKVVLAAHIEGKPVAICGELAADHNLLQIFIGLGINELSVNPTAIPIIKEKIRKISFLESKRIANQSLSLKSWEEIAHLNKAK